MRTTVVATILVAVVATVFLAVHSQTVLLALFGAMLVGEAVRPFVNRLSAMMPRAAAVAVTFALVFAALALVWLLPLGALVPQAATFFSNLPGFLNDATVRVTAFAQDPRHAAMAGRLSTIVPGVSGALSTIFFNAQATLAATLGTFSLALVMALFWLGSSEALAPFLLSLVPPGRRPKTAALFAELSSKLGSYVSATVVNSVMIAVECLVALVVLRTPYPFVLGALQGLLSAIPYVGAFVGVLLIGAVVFAAQGWVAALIAIAVISVIYGIQGTFVTPLIFKRGVDIDPLATIVATAIGGTLFGIPGAVLAVPAASVVQTIIVFVIAPAIRSRYAPGDGEQRT